MKKEIQRLDVVVFPDSVEGKALLQEFSDEFLQAFPGSTVTDTRERVEGDAKDEIGEHDGHLYYDLTFDPNMFEEIMAWIILEGWGRCSHALISLSEMRREGNFAGIMVSEKVHQLVKKQRPDIMSQKGVDNLPDRMESIVPKESISVNQMAKGTVDLLVFPKDKEGDIAAGDFKASLKRDMPDTEFNVVPTQKDEVGISISLPNDQLNDYLAWLIGNGWMMGSNFMDAIMQLVGRKVPQAIKQMKHVQMIVDEKYPGCYEPGNPGMYNNKYLPFAKYKNKVVAHSESVGDSEKRMKKELGKDIVEDLSSDEN